MPPKKKVTDAQVLDEKRQQLESLKRQCQAVEQLMMLASDEIRYMDHEKHVLEKKLADLQEQMEAMERKTDEHVRIMQHMSTTNDEQLRQRLKSLEQLVADAEQGNAVLRQKIEETKKGKEEELQQLKNNIAVMRETLEVKALECGAQLRDILLANP
ncbi:uncharacterized protein TM35_000341440 [Trypanosoma theileri]|uniref:Uncharacterized protein n=1 Tax=Trypanosoma theileri TaxID=67003 RepID=A0A1X0NL82_9TRYP|nr:uncharacterized protein TM35_000341440 [Trypanosoma theileri]ORC85532.1 hypothetical protein TM35_000341440 [Trypanosoma theileri]